ncbi:unnamed protein product, partial [marine sediment metagenome]
LVSIPVLIDWLKYLREVLSVIFLTSNLLQTAFKSS